jgi:hypothetical protein
MFLGLQTDINIDPIIKVTLVRDIYNYKYTMIIINEGINDISEITVMKRLGIYDLKNLKKSAFVNFIHYWLSKDKLKSGDSIAAQIPFGEITQAWGMYKNPYPYVLDSSDIEYIFPAIVLKIKYLRQSDKKYYTYSKILFLADESIDNYGVKFSSIALYDPDENERNKELLVMLRQYENNNNWLLPKINF